jgi:hypothetical protein
MARFQQLARRSLQELLPGLRAVSEPLITVIMGIGSVPAIEYH